MKTKTLTSGNVLEYEQIDWHGRGGVRARFRTEPSEADISDGKAFLLTLVPARASVVASGESQGTARTKALLENFLGQGSSN